jgi:hypothetical protein
MPSIQPRICRGVERLVLPLIFGGNPWPRTRRNRIQQAAGNIPIVSCSIENRRAQRDLTGYSAIAAIQIPQTNRRVQGVGQ